MRGGARSFGGTLLASLCLSAGPAQAAFVELIATSRVGSTSSFDIIYQPEGASGLQSFDVVITTDVSVTSLGGTLSPATAGAFVLSFGDPFGAGSTECGGAGSLACVYYSAITFGPDVPTPGPLTLGTLTVDVGINPATELIQGIRPTLFVSAAGILPNNTVDPLATVPEPDTLALVGLGLASVSLLRRRRVAGR